MTKYEIIFPIDDTFKIIIPLKDPVEWLGPIYQEKILLLSKTKKIILSQTTIYHDLLYLSDLLKKTLNHKLFLHSSISQDIGYFYNEHHYHDTKLPVTVLPNGSVNWVGYVYHLWESLSHFNSWIYNAPDGSIVFEVTPFYPYMYCEPEEEPDYIPYEEWIKTYKPYFITTLSKETALQWLEQAERIIKIVEDNQKRWDNMPKEDVES
jgi:hypothetical protein